jgi:GNAT superfamily N-acetyltransferase
MPTSEPLGKDIVVRTLREADLPAADRIFRLAFGTFLGLPNPIEFHGDADFARTRWIADPSATFGADLGGNLVASNFATRWGSVGFFGPLTVRPDLWDRGVAKRLIEATMELFAKWATTHEGLFTFAHSPKHIALYHKFGFWPRFLTAIMSKPVNGISQVTQFSRFSEVPACERAACLIACRELTDAVYEGLDVQREILAVDAQGLGDTVLLWNAAGLAGFAVCHCGSGTEAGSGVCYVKFAAVTCGPTANHIFGLLLDSCERFAALRQLSRVVAGVNAGRERAYRQMMAYGFRTDFQGVAMQRHNDPGYNRSEVYVIDDWR